MDKLVQVYGSIKKCTDIILVSKERAGLMLA